MESRSLEVTVVSNSAVDRNVRFNGEAHAWSLVEQKLINIKKIVIYNGQAGSLSHRIVRNIMKSTVDEL